MTQDRRQRGKVDSSLRQARCECVSQVIEHEIENDSVFLRLPQYSVMSAIQAADVSTRIAPRWEDPVRLISCQSRIFPCCIQTKYLPVIGFQEEVTALLLSFE